MMERAAYSDWFSANIYPMARSFASKHPIPNVEFDDYVQELATKAWEKMADYDPRKSTVSTFVYLWFGSQRIALLDKEIHRAKVMAQSEAFDADGNECDPGLLAESDEDVAGSYSGFDAFAMVGPIAQAYFMGDSVKDVCEAFGMTKKQVMDAVSRDVDSIRDKMEVYL